MSLNSLKPALLTLSMLAVAACGTPPGPRTHDSSGRAMASSALATTIFMNVCFKTGGSKTGAIRAIKRDKNIVFSEKLDSRLDVSKNLTSAKHKTHSLDVLHMPGACAVSFDNGQPNAKQAAEAAILLLPKIGAKSIGGKRGGGQISLKTSRGTVLIINSTKTGSNGAMLTLFQK